jgi:hypothetical protein
MFDYRLAKRQLGLPVLPAAISQEGVEPHAEQKGGARMGRQAYSRLKSDREDCGDHESHGQSTESQDRDKCVCAAQARAFDSAHPGAGAQFI